MEVRVQNAPGLPPQAIPSHSRVEPGSINIPIGKWPDTAKSASVDPSSIAAQVIMSFNNALASKDYEALSKLFLNDGYWRDHLAGTWDLRTLKGPEKILSFLGSGCKLKEVKVDDSTSFREPHLGPFCGASDAKGVEFYITLTTEIGSGNGLMRLAEENEQWKIFTLFTRLHEITGHEEPVGPRRTQGVEHGGKPDRKNWLERRVADVEYKDRDPTVVIVGGGQGGLTLAARLKMQNVDALIVDSQGAIGDNWRNRYHQLVLHDPIWYDHMPYMSFPPHWPIFTPKDKLAEFFESYVKLLELNVWLKSTIEASSWDESKQEWTLKMKRTKPDGSVGTQTLHPRHVVQATGHSGKKNFPSHINGISSFRGTRLCHSSEFSGASMDGRGKKAVVVGSCNSGHDIAQDFYEKGYDVTMVQRSSTCVVSSESITDIGLKGLYSEDGPPVDDADVMFHSIPSEVFKAAQLKLTQLQAAHDADTLSGLEKAGFKLDKGPDDCGLTVKYFQRGGGYYIDVGGSQLIIDGKIKIKQGQEITEVLPHGLKFADATELEADEIIFATGYQNMRSQARLIFGDAVADRCGEVWGYDEEGEVRTIWRRSGQPGFWFMGGNLALCRYYSRVLALQIKAIEVGLMGYV